MELSLNRLRYQFYARNHLHSLLSNEPLVFCISTEKEAWKVTFSRNDFSFERTNQLEDITTKITTVNQIALELLSGNIRLSQLKGQHEIVYEGSFRHFLLLESVLWLCRDYNEHVEAVSF